MAGGPLYPRSNLAKNRGCPSSRSLTAEGWAATNLNPSSNEPANLESPILTADPLPFNQPPGWAGGSYLGIDLKLCRCRPSLSKLAGASHASSASFLAGHSQSSMENQAVSRFLPLTTICWRKIPSKVNPSRSAARRLATFSALHFHS